jgi:cytochrome c peroxidase
MHRNVLVHVGLPFALALALAMSGYSLFAQDHPQAGDKPPIYFPYPSGLMPADLQSEIDRVNREVDQIFQGALAKARALPPPNLASNPPITQGTGTERVETLGRLELFDNNLSVNRNQACSFCHMPYTGFTGPISSINATVVAYPGSVHFRFSNRKPMAYTYSPYYPPLHYNETQQDFYGGNFWDLRATGYKLQNPDAEQAQHPIVDTQEQGFPDAACVVFRLSQSEYRSLFETVWGKQSFDIQWPADTEKICSTPGGAEVFKGNLTPLNLSPVDRGRADASLDHYALSITAYESSEAISPFSSKFDAFLAGNATLADDEMAGWELFRGKAKCNMCHLDGTANSTQAAITPNNAASVAPLFTDFTSANLGIPTNIRNPIYFQNVPDSYGFTRNPAGAGLTDLGVGNFLRSQNGVNPNAAWIPLAPKFNGKMQVQTLRNVDMRPCPTFVKAYMHNGYLKSLKEVVHFYNTRDVLPRCKQGDPGEKATCWPAPEVDENLSKKLGDLKLTDREEDQIVEFLKSLTDGYTRPYADANAYTGACPK